MRVDLFDFDLPSDRIAARPMSPRDEAKLLHVVPRKLRGTPEASAVDVERDLLADVRVKDLPHLLRPGDHLVFNDTRVIPARLFGRRGAVTVELLLHRQQTPDTWIGLSRPAKRLKPGQTIEFEGDLRAEVIQREGAMVTVRFDRAGAALMAAIARIGHVPLPPYIRRPDDAQDRRDYQTIYAAHDGAVAAPTAGLHFTPALMDALAAAGFARSMVTLHVGAGTFLPVTADDTADHAMQPEWGEVTAETAARINRTRASGGRIVAVGSTSLRLLESAAAADGTLQAFSGDTALFVTPGYRFKAVDAFFTNFHLPRSTLFMLVAAFAGIDTMRAAYAHAIAAGYRFYSYGDACLLERGEIMTATMTGDTTALGFNIDATDGRARRGRLVTAHGTIDTPAFMPVGTAATVKAMFPETVAAAGAQIILANTYHLMLRPGAQRMARFGGVRAFMGWPGPVLTDSGGYQVMSLAKLRRMTEDGVTFQSHVDGTSHHLTPERSIEIQHALGATITMAFDECTPYPADKAAVADSMRLSMRWAARSKQAFKPRPGHGLFGIVQGGVHGDLRAESAAALKALGFDGYAIGGLAVGEGQDLMFSTLDHTVPELPADRPRYLMGVGKPADIVGAVARGCDMFDCVLPTRSGRTAQAFTRFGTLNLRNARHADDSRPLDETIDCPASRNYSRGYYHHLFRCEEVLGLMLLTWHNVAFYQQIMRELRAAIAAGTLTAYMKTFAADQARGEQGASGDDACDDA